ncbi:MAG: DUF4012 domain-containing protein [Actinomycetota bacterium]
MGPRARRIIGWPPTKAKLLRLGVGVVTVGWIVGVATSATAARAAYADATARLGPATQAAERGDQEALERELTAARAAVGNAQASLRSVWLRPLEVIPVLGRTVRAARMVGESAVMGADAALVGTRALRGLISGSEGISLDHFDPKGWEPARAGLTDAERRLTLALRQAENAPGSGVFGPVARARSKAIRDLRRLNEATSDAAAGARLGAHVFASGRPRAFLLVVQNLAEARATGGLVGGYALLEARGGEIHLKTVASNVQIPPLPIKDSIPMPKWYRKRYDKFASRAYWSNSTMEPDFRVTGKVLAGLFERQHGRAVDGVISVDPIALQDLLRATGPIAGSDGVRLDGDTFASFFMNGAYVKYPSGGTNGDRKQVFERLAVDVWKAALEHRDAAALFRALADTAPRRHLMVWLADASAERDAERLDIAGSFRAPGSSIGVVTQNASASKIEYYLRRAFSVRAQVRAAEVSWRARIKLTNHAPSGGLPNVILGPDMATSPGAPPGQNHAYVSVYVSPTARVRRFVFAGKPVDYTVEHVPGATVISAFVDIPPRSSRIADVWWTEPRTADSISLTVMRQPTVAPDRLSVEFTDATAGNLKCVGSLPAVGACKWAGLLDGPLEFHASQAKSWWRF